MNLTVKNLISITFRVIKLVILIGLFVTLLSYQLKIDQEYGVFEWIDSPTYNPFRDYMGILVVSVIIWLLSKRFISRGKLENPVNKTYTLFFDIIQKTSVGVWFMLITLLAVFAIQNPPADVSDIERVEILKIETPGNQSKPYKTYYRVSSWRGNKYETLSTYIINLHDAKQLRESKFATLYIGEDWLGRIRVLRVRAVRDDVNISNLGISQK